MDIASPPLPGELIDTIIHILLSDRHTIKPCALICRAWLPWTRLQLFHTVRLCKENFHSFILLFQSPYCTFPPFVRCIHVDCLWDLPHIPSTHHDALQDVLYSQHAWLTRTDGGTKDSFIRKAKTSIVNAINRSTSSHVMNVVRLFPAVEHLHLSLDEFQLGVGECNGLPSVSPTLKSLLLACESPWVRYPRLSHQWKNFLKWIHQQRICGINKLYLERMSSADIEGAEALLKAQGNALKHLHIAIPDASFHAPLYPHQPLRVVYNPELESVHFKMFSKPTIRIMAHMLKEFPPNKITTVAFDIREGSLIEPESDPNLQRIGDELASRRFPELSRILVRVQIGGKPRYTLSESLNILRRIFPSSRRVRRALEVESFPSDCDKFRWDTTHDCASPRISNKAENVS